MVFALLVQTSDCSAENFAPSLDFRRGIRDVLICVANHTPMRSPKSSDHLKQSFLFKIIQTNSLGVIVGLSRFTDGVIFW
jgi:hypothetical protein